MRWRLVKADPLVVVVAPHHPWARRRAPLTAAELAATPMLLREPGSGTREVLDAALGSVGLQATIPLLELGSTAAIKAAVACSTGPTVLGRLTTAADVAEGGSCRSRSRGSTFSASSGRSGPTTVACLRSPAGWCGWP
jgi:DNA-binding transcriptional LysR family regulator